MTRLADGSVEMSVCYACVSGCFATITALSLGLWNFKSGRSQASQRMMRMRVVAQGFTVAALIGGIAANALKSPAANEAASK